jgi:hypothetical protein
MVCTLDNKYLFLQENSSKHPKIASKFTRSMIARQRKKHICKQETKESPVFFKNINSNSNSKQ